MYLTTRISPAVWFQDNECSIGVFSNMILEMTYHKAQNFGGGIFWQICQQLPKFILQNSTLNNNANFVKKIVPSMHDLRSLSVASEQNC